MDILVDLLYSHACMQVADTPIVLMSIPRFHLKFLQPYPILNGSVEFATSLKTIEIPFYINDDYLYFNASKASEIGVEDRYHVVITATHETEPGRVGMVLTTVRVERGGCTLVCLYRL